MKSCRSGFYDFGACVRICEYSGIYDSHEFIKTRLKVNSCLIMPRKGTAMTAKIRAAGIPSRRYTCRL